MDISSSLSGQPGSPTSPTRRHGRSSSLSNGLLSMLSSSSSQPSPQPFVPGHRARTSSVFSLFSGGQAPPPSNRSGLGLGLSTSASEEEEIDPDQPLPTLEVQPAMLAVDLSLAPGESRTCTRFLFVVHHFSEFNVRLCLRHVYLDPPGESTPDVSRTRPQVLVPIHSRCVSCGRQCPRSKSIKQQ